MAQTLSLRSIELSVNGHTGLQNLRFKLLLAELFPSGWRGRLQDLSFELKSVLFVPDPPAAAGQPLSGTDGWHGAKDRYLIPMPANLHPEHGEPALLIEKGDALDKSCDLFRR